MFRGRSCRKSEGVKPAEVYAVYSMPITKVTDAQHHADDCRKETNQSTSKKMPVQEMKLSGVPTPPKKLHKTKETNKNATSHHKNLL